MDNFACQIFGEGGFLVVNVTLTFMFLNCWNDPLVDYADLYTVKKSKHKQLWDILNSAIENEQSQQIQQRKKQCLVKFIVFFHFLFQIAAELKIYSDNVTQ